MVKPNSVYFLVWCVLKYYAEAHLRVLDKVCPVCLELIWFHLDVMFFLKKKKETEKWEGIVGQEWLRIREFKYLCEQFFSAVALEWVVWPRAGMKWERWIFYFPSHFQLPHTFILWIFYLAEYSVVTIWYTNIN